MITNLTATITFALVTNWTLATIETPAPKTPPADGSPVYLTTLEYRATGYHYAGIIISNTVAEIHWGTNRIPVVIQTQYIGTTKKSEWR